MSLPTLLVISATIRRDLHRPFRRFRKFRVVHAYMDAAYGDMDAADLEGTRQFRTLTDLHALIVELKPDLIQAPEPVASRAMLKAAWVVWRWHRSTGTPYFFPMFENLPLKHKFGLLVGWVMGTILRRFAQDAAWAYVLNEGARQTLASLGLPAEKLIRANWGNWGLDRTEFRPARPLRRRRAPQPVVLFVGRLSAAKGIDTLLDAFRVVRRSIKTAQLWIVGPTTLDVGNESLFDRAKAMKGVRLVGPKKQRLLPAMFHKAWVTVLFSRTTTRWAEQVGMVNLQSLACGTPVVTTTSGSIPEYLESEKREARSEKLGKITIHDTENGALLVPEDAPAAAAQAILMIVQDSRRREAMGQAGVRWIKRTFDEAVAVPGLERATFQRFQSLRSTR